MTKIYRFMDQEGKGEIGFYEFTLLSEERWQNIDCYAQYLKGVEGRAEALKKENDSASVASALETSEMGSGVGDAQGYAQLEDLARI